MKFKNIFILTGMVLLVGSASAQYAEDALRFSQSENGSTARFKALGNAQTALGGDISSLSSNPAGLGLFTKREFTFTPEFSNNSVNTQYTGPSSTFQKNKAGINQAGVVFYNPLVRRNKSDATKGLISVNFGVSYNKTNNFNATVDYNGNNSKNSFTDYLADLGNNSLMNGNPLTKTNALPAGSLEKMAYNNYLIEYNSGGYFSTTAVNPSNNQRNTVFHTGSQSEVNFGASANLNNQLYVGASLALTSLDYNADREFIETGKTRAFKDQPAAFVNAAYNLNYQSNQQTSGEGINAKLGFIFRPTPNFRIGASFISPTYYSITDETSENLETQYTPPNGSYIAPYTNTAQVYPVDYTLRTPYKLNGGVAFLFSKIGLLSADIEYVDYASIKYDSDDVFTNTNMRKDIRDFYKGAVNFKVGTELKVVPSIMVRAGYNMQGNPYQNTEYSSNAFSAGFGYKVNNISFDLTFINTAIQYYSRPYKIRETYPDYKFTGNSPEVNINTTLSNVFATIGYKF